MQGSSCTEKLVDKKLNFELTIINLLPKQITEIQVSSSLKEDNTKKMSSLKEVYFIAHDHRGKKLKKLIKSYSKA